MVLPETAPTAAVMVAVPGEAAAARPEVFMLATVGALEFQDVTDAVRFCVDPSEKVPITVNCWAMPVPRLCAAGVTAID